MNTSTKTVKVNGGGGGLLWLTFFVFLILKLTSVISWSWWWVTAPLWVPTALYISFALIALIIGYTIYSIGVMFSIFGNRR